MRFGSWYFDMLDIFSEKKWRKIQDNYEAWWRRETDRPIINLSFWGDEPKMKRPDGLVTGNLFHYPQNEPAESIAEKLEYLMRSLCYEFDGFPYIFMYFGPVSLVEFFGARAHIAENTVWYEAKDAPPIQKMRAALSPYSVFYPRYCEIAKACEQRFAGGYVISAPSGGGYSLDIVAEFYKPTKLCYMLYDLPEEVNRLAMEFHDSALSIAQSLISLTPSARGYSSWGGMYAPKPWISMQCDFSAMIGPEHFERFVKWELELSSKNSPEYNYYHLDGTGELAHLDSILSVQNLKCVQWVPEAGKPGASFWPDVYRKISGADKNIWVVGSIEDLEAVADQIGTTKGLYWQGGYHISEQSRIMKIAERLAGGRYTR